MTRRIASTTAAVLAISTLAAACTGGSDAIEVPGVTTTLPTTPQTVAVTTIATEPDPPTESSVESQPQTAPTDPSADPEDTNGPEASETTATPETGDSPPATEASEDVFLRIGDEGPEVGVMQLKLQVLGYLDPGYPEGVFDQATADGLIDFQAQYGLIVDGIFGPETDRALTAAAESVNPEPS